MKNELTTNSKTTFISVATDRPAFKNASLESITKAIETTWSDAQSAIIETARRTKMRIYELSANVEANSAYKDDGFKDSAEWLEKTFGVKYSTAKAYIQIGKAIIDGTIPRDIDLGIDALRMLSTKGEETKKLIESGEVHSGMTKNEVAEILNASKEKKQSEPRPEKEYKWQCVSMENRHTIVATEDMMVSGNWDWNRKIRNDSGIFLIFARSGAVVVYQRMEEITEATDSTEKEGEEA